MNQIDKLAEYFEKFPGVGPRQAKRFVYYLLAKGKNFSGDFARAITELHDHTYKCDECQIYFSSPQKQSKCVTCSDKNKDASRLIIVARDMDAQNILKTEEFDGLFFVLGGTLPVLEEKNASRFIREAELKGVIKAKTESGLKEVILALNANPEGENTSNYIEQILKEDFSDLTISHLGRGLSTGSEIEYADRDTIKSALESRN